MNFSFVNKALGFGQKTFAVIKPHLPKIMVAAGSASVVAGTFFACKATLKADEIIDIHQAQMEKIHECANKVSRDEYTDKDIKKDKLQVYAATAGSFAKLYGAAVGLYVTGFGLIFGGFGLIQKWHTLALTAFSALDEKFAAYRGNVIESYGSDVDKQLLTGAVEKTIDISSVGEDGNTKIVKKEATCIDVNAQLDDFTRVFNNACGNMWEDSYLFNENFLHQTELIWTRDLQSGRKSHVYLEDLIDYLGLPETEKKPIDHWYGWISKPGANVNLHVQPFIVWTGEAYDDPFGVSPDEGDQFPMNVILPVDYNEDGNMFFINPEDEDLWKMTYATNPSSTGYYLTFNVDSDENGIPREIYTQVSAGLSSK